MTGVKRLDRVATTTWRSTKQVRQLPNIPLSVIGQNHFSLAYLPIRSANFGGLAHIIVVAP